MRSEGQKPLAGNLRGFCSIVFLAALCLCSSVTHASVSSEPEYLEALARQELSVWRPENARRAIDLFSEAADKWSDRGDPIRKASCMRHIAEVRLMLGEPAKAIDAASSALRLGNLRNVHAATSNAYSLMAIGHVRIGETRKAERLAEQAMAIADAAGDPLAIGKALMAHSEIAFEKQDFQRMLDDQRFAVERFREAGNVELEIDAMRHQAFSHVIVGQRFVARAVAESALERAASIGNRRLQALSAISLGESFARIGEWNAALNHFQFAENNFPEGLDKFDHAVLFSRLGMYFLTYGNHQRTRNYLEGSLSLFDSIGNHAGVAEITAVLAALHTQAGEFDDAANLYDRALRTVSKFRDPGATGLIYEGLADLELARGRLDEAKTFYARSLKEFGQLRIDHATARLNEKFGRIHEQNGDAGEAKKFFLTAYRLNKSISNLEGESRDLFNLSRIALVAGETTSALKRIEESIDLTEKLQKETESRSLTMSFRSNVIERYKLLVKLHLNGQGLNDRESKQKSFQVAERSRARVLLNEMMLAHSLGGHTRNTQNSEKESALREQLSSLNDELTDLIGVHGRESEVSSIYSQVADLEHQLEELYAGSRRSNSAYSDVVNLTYLDVADFQASILNENEVLVEYLLDEDRSYLWLVGKDRFETFALPAKAEIEEKADSLRDLLEARKPRQGETFEERHARILEADAKYTPLARDLSNIILGPAAEWLAGKRLIVVPDGKLHYLPLSALPLPNSTSDEPILLTNEVVYQPSAQAFALLRKHGHATRQNTAKDLLVFSDPVFSPNDPRLGGPDQVSNDLLNSDGVRFRLVESFSSLTRLPATESEAKAVIETVGGRYDNFSGFDATRERLINLDLADYSIVHLATHGKTDIQRPELSSIVLSRFSPDGRPIDEAIRIQDIYSMKLNADLIVLSACESGTGKEIKGEGVMGLNTAFLQSGARSVVSSLWVVEDNAANLLMKKFYGSMIADGMSPSAALRSAQIELYKQPQYRSPFFWAAFTIQGNAGSRLPIADRPNYFWPAAIALGIIATLAIGVFLLRRRQRASKL